MDIKVVAKGKRLIKAGESVNRMYVVLKGSIRQTYNAITVDLGPGTVVGLTDALRDTYESEYVAMEESSVVPCFYEDIESFYSIFEQQPVYIFGFAKGAFRQCRDIFVRYDEALEKSNELYSKIVEFNTRYLALCREYKATSRNIPIIEDLEPIMLPAPIQKWEHDYIDSLNSVPNQEIEKIYGSRCEIVVGVICTCCGYVNRAADAVEICGFYNEEFINAIISTGDDEIDLFGAMYELRVFFAQRRIDPQPIEALINEVHDYLEKANLVDGKQLARRWKEYTSHNFHEDTQAYEQALEEANEQYEDCFEHIATFAGLKEEQKAKIKANIEEFLALEDRESKEDRARKLRKTVTEDFYSIYEKAFFKSLNVHEITPILEMFLHFGFMTIDAVGDDLAEQLLDLTENLRICNSEHVFTIYSWLMAVYEGKREPSKNELDLDYRGYILEERKNGNIQESQVQQYMANQTEKVKFEIHNFFKSANRTTSGKMTSFCPILTEEGFGVELNRMLLTVERLNTALEKIESIDFGMFYRESYFSSPEFGINSESIMERVEPDMILLPNTGMRSMLWQECGGIKVNTPARFVFPLFTLEDVDKLMINCCGAFRWEICRREQGARWNDIGSNCLTSEFYDYLTFYKKNKDLSTEQKEKIKTTLKNNRNNMREFFNKEYSIWINFEAAGSVRLNKVERDIFVRFCPFAKKIRATLTDHPMYAESLSRYNVQTNQKLHHLKMVLDKYVREGGEITPELQNGLDFYGL